MACDGCSFAGQTVAARMAARFGVNAGVDIHRLIHRKSGQWVKTQENQALALVLPDKAQISAFALPQNKADKALDSFSCYYLCTKKEERCRPSVHKIRRSNS
jgi:hypothetical protein